MSALAVPFADGATDAVTSIPLPADLTRGDLVLLSMSNLTAFSDARFTTATDGLFYWLVATPDTTPITAFTHGPDGFGDNGHYLAVIRNVRAVSDVTVTAAATDILELLPIPVAVAGGLWDAAVCWFSVHGRGSPGSLNIDNAGQWGTYFQQVTTPFYADGVATWDRESGRTTIPAPVTTSNSQVVDFRRFAVLGISVRPPVTRRYPRDDGLGLSSGPRLYPPPKGRRRAGGYL